MLDLSIIGLRIIIALRIITHTHTKIQLKIIWGKIIAIDYSYIRHKKV